MVLRMGEVGGRFAELKIQTRSGVHFLKICSCIVRKVGVQEGALFDQRLKDEKGRKLKENNVLPEKSDQRWASEPLVSLSRKHTGHGNTMAEEMLAFSRSPCVFLMPKDRDFRDCDSRSLPKPCPMLAARRYVESVSTS